MNSCYDLINEVQVLFKGGLCSGKSTLLNALMRKNILRTGITPKTAVITKIIFNKDEKVIVYKKETDAPAFGNIRFIMHDRLLMAAVRLCPYAVPARYRTFPHAMLARLVSQRSHAAARPSLTGKYYQKHNAACAGI